MSFNTSQTGREICIIKDNPTYKNKIISVSDSEQDGKLNHIFKDLHIKTGKFQLICDKTEDRHTMFVSGHAGSGKSYFVAQYVKEFIKTYPEQEIFLISENTDDPALDSIKEIIRLRVGEYLIEDPFDWTEFHNCLIIYDDIDSINGPVGKHINNFRDKMLKNSRKHKVSVICTNHNPCERQLKSVIQESDTVVFFLKKFNRSLKYLLKEYLGLDDDAIKALRKNKTRATAYINSDPICIVQDNNITLLNKIQKQ